MNPMQIVCFISRTTTAKTRRVRVVTRMPALTVNTVLSRTGTGLRSDGAIADSAGYAQQQRVHGFQRIPARRSIYRRYPDRSSHASLASATTLLEGECMAFLASGSEPTGAGSSIPTCAGSLVSAANQCY